MSISVSVYEKNQNFDYNSFGWYVNPKATTTGQKFSYETSTSCYGSNESISTCSDEDSFYKLSKSLKNHNNVQQKRPFHVNQHSSVSFYTGEEEPNGSHKNNSLGSSESMYGPSSERWFVLAVVCLSVAVRSFVSVVFGQINDVFSVYFDVAPSSVDWLTNLSSLTTLVCISFVAFCNHKQFNLRSLCLSMAITGFIGTSLLTFAMTTREQGYVISLLGQILMGANNAVVMTIPPLVTTTWFPAGEIATALAFVLVFVGLGEALGSYLPGVVVFLEDDSELVGMFDGSGEVFASGESELLEDNDLFDIVRYRLVMLFVFTAGITGILLVLMVAFLREKPKMPPSYAELVVRKLQRRDAKMRKDHVVESNGEISDANSITSTVVRSFQSSKTISCLISNKMFMITALLYGIVAASASTSITLLSSLIRTAFDENIAGDALSGKIMTVLWVCFVIGSFGAGRILDAYRCYRKLTIIGLFGVALGCLGIPLSLMDQNTLQLYCAHVILGLSMGMTETSLFEIASEVTYPSPPLTFAALLTVSWMIFFVAYPIIGRYLLNNIQGIFNLSNAAATALSSSAPWICASICLVVAVCIFHPQQKRSSKVKQKKSERTPLLSVEAS